MGGAEDEIDDIYRSFDEAGKTDGLPIVPPTERRVERMLEGTALGRGTELGTLGTREGVLTVEKLAVNGVMAGCLPIHMPVLVAGAKALVDPQSNAIQVSVSTGSWAYLFVVNGPIRETAAINSDTAAFGPGFRSNRTIGRALGLAYKNCAQIHPGQKEMSTLGSPFKFSLVAGENSERSPWEPLHVERGYDADESTITFAAPNSFLQYLPNQMTAEGVAESLVRNTPRSVAGFETETANERFEGFQSEVFYALCPYNAAELAEYSKAEIKEYIYENARRSASEFSPGFSEAADDERALPSLQTRHFEDPEYINLIVTGGTGRFNAVIGPTLGGPTTKRIELPDNWAELTDRYGPQLDHDWGRPGNGDG